MKKIEPDHDVIVRSLQAFGCPVSQMVSTAEPDFRVEQPSPAQVFVLHPKGQDEFVFPLTITNTAYAPLTLCGFECRLPWVAMRVQWLFPSTPESENFRLPSGRVFSRSTVLNCTEHQRTLDCNESVTGVLLGLADRGFPDDYLHGQEFSAKLFTTDQHGRRQASEIFVVVERTVQMAGLDFTRRRKSNLFEPLRSPLAIQSPPARDWEQADSINGESAGSTDTPSQPGDRSVN